MHGIDRAARGVGRHRCKQRGIKNAEADFLAFHVAIGDGDAELLVNRIALGFRPPANHDAGDAHRKHRRPDRPAMLLIFCFAAEMIGHRAADAQQREHLEEIREWRGIFKRVRGVGVRVTAAVGAKHLDGHLRRHRTLNNRLRVERLVFHHRISLGINDGFSIRIVFLDGNGLRLHQFRRRVRLEILNHALRDEEQREHKADRQQQIISDARQIHPEVADGRGRMPCYAAHQRGGDGDTGGGGKKVVDGQRDHLREIRHRRFAAVALPVGVRRETDGGVKREMFGQRAEMLRIERQVLLQAQNCVSEKTAHEAEN